MINCAAFYNTLKDNGIDFFTGVPDSLLKDFCAYVTDKVSRDRNIITANEGNAVALAAGRYLATEQISLVYMQNSGIGNIVNPVTSLVDPLVYSIPVLFLIGWRGEPGVKDEPQHVKQGKITLDILDTLGVKYAILPQSIQEASEAIKEAVQYMQQNDAPYALVVSKGTFEDYKLKNQEESRHELSREDAIKLIASSLDEQAVIVSTTGMASRELYEFRDHNEESHNRDFLTVGSMGHASQIALGIALADERRMVYCLDGDGAFIMHMGGVAIIGDQAPLNYRHILINNGAHDSVGGQPTVGLNIDTLKIAKACGYKEVFMAETEEELIKHMQSLKTAEGPLLLEVRVNKGARSDLGRPKVTPIENKKAFIQFLSKR